MAEETKPSLTARLAELGILSADSTAAGLTLRSVVAGGGTPVLSPELKVGEEIGRGAMASIKRAEQGSLLRTVAIKTLLPHNRQTGDQRAFFAESLVTARLEHPNIVPVHDLVRDGDGELQLVMKRVLGLTWMAILHPQTERDETVAAVMDLDDHLDVLLKVCDAVAYAHSRGVMHRDLKPENVMIGDFGEVLVMDWGCAATFDRSRAVAGVPHFADLTTISGTPNYIAPEVACAADSRTGPWSDVFGLGGMLYEILTGEPPHYGKTVREVLENAASGRLVSPRHRNPARAMPDELVELCNEAMALDVTERIQSASDFAERLRDHRRHGEAHRLAKAARNHLKQAEKKPDDRGRLIRRAVVCFEQAIDQWPHRSIRIQAANAFLSAARYATEQGDHDSARSDAGLARKLAHELGFTEQVREAELLMTSIRRHSVKTKKAVAQLEDTPSSQQRLQPPGRQSTSSSSRVQPSQRLARSRSSAPKPAVVADAATDHPAQTAKPTQTDRPAATQEGSGRSLGLGIAAASAVIGLIAGFIIASLF